MTKHSKEEVHLDNTDGEKKRKNLYHAIQSNAAHSYGILEKQIQRFIQKHQLLKETAVLP
jgi:hypothetical protein